MFNDKLLSLLQLADPALPIGGFSHSSGLETYVQHGIVTSLDSAKEFITGMLTHNLQHTDAALLSLAFDCAMQNDLEGVIRWDVVCKAVKLTAEIRQASQKLGWRLLKIFEPVCHHELAERYKTAVQLQETPGSFCITFGLLAAILQIPKADAITGFFYNAAAGLVTNCVKLIPLGQQGGQELLFGLQPLIERLVACSMDPDISLIGFCCSGFDIRSMQHEQLYSRLYIS